jgi:hypothetical protein
MNVGQKVTSSPGNNSSFRTMGSSEKIHLILSIIAAVGYLTSSSQCKSLFRIAEDVRRITGCQEGMTKGEEILTCLKKLLVFGQTSFTSNVPLWIQLEIAYLFNKC